MIITPVDDENRLFLLRDILPRHLVDQILLIDWKNLSWTKQERQEYWKRRKIDYLQVPEIIEINSYIQSLYQEVEQQCSIILTARNHISTSWWYDEPGFNVPIHTDGQLPSAMQIFWAGADVTKGTKFYNSKSIQHLKYDFPFEVNTGYLMLNAPNDDGSQPLQWHGMMNTLGPDTYRITSYTIFNSYTAK
jgi:hypothetical protein